MSFVFLICSERSGSNLITSVMNGHSQISGPPPSHLFRLFGLNAENYMPLSQDENWHIFLDDFVEAGQNMIGQWDSKTSKSDLIQNCKDRNYSSVFDYFYAKERGPNEKISFVKENYTYLIMDFLLSHWPDSKFIYQTRDPRDMVASWLATPFQHQGVKAAITQWTKDQTQSLETINNSAFDRPVLKVQYEELITDQIQTVKNICRFLGLDYEPEMEEFYNHQRTRRNAAQVYAWGNLAKPIMPKNKGKYKKSLTAIDIQYIELMCGDLMQELGYKLDTNALDIAPDKRDILLKELEANLSKGVDMGLIPEDQRAQRQGRQALINKIKTRQPVPFMSAPQDAKP